MAFCVKNLLCLMQRWFKNALTWKWLRWKSVKRFANNGDCGITTPCLGPLAYLKTNFIWGRQIIEWSQCHYRARHLHKFSANNRKNFWQNGCRGRCFLFLFIKFIIKFSKARIFVLQTATKTVETKGTDRRNAAKSFLSDMNKVLPI